MKKKYSRIIGVGLALLCVMGCQRMGGSQPPPVIEDVVSSEPEVIPEPKAPVDRRAEEIYNNNPQLVPVNFESPALLPISEEMDQQYIDDMVFLCDSPMYWLKLHGLLSEGKESKQLWTGPEGTMTLAYQGEYAILDPYDLVERPIREVVELHKPKTLMITLGINGVSFMDEEYFVTEYTDLVTDIQEISPDTTIILQSILPITPAYRYWGVITNEKITTANSWILKIAEDYNCYYLDSFSVLVGEDGNAKAEYMMKDGLHANAEGLSLVLDYIKTHGVVSEESL